MNAIDVKECLADWIGSRIQVVTTGNTRYHIPLTALGETLVLGGEITIPYDQIVEVWVPLSGGEKGEAE